MTDEQIRRATAISKQQLENSKDWIVIIQSTNFLQDFASKDEAVKYWLLVRLDFISKDK